MHHLAIVCDHLNFTMAIQSQRVISVAPGELLSSGQQRHKERAAPEERYGAARTTGRVDALLLHQSAAKQLVQTYCQYCGPTCQPIHWSSPTGRLFPRRTPRRFAVKCRTPEYSQLDSESSRKAGRSLQVLRRFQLAAEVLSRRPLLHRPYLGIPGPCLRTRQRDREL